LQTPNLNYPSFYINNTGGITNITSIQGFNISISNTTNTISIFAVAIISSASTGAGAMRLIAFSPDNNTVDWDNASSLDVNTGSSNNFQLLTNRKATVASYSTSYMSKDFPFVSTFFIDNNATHKYYVNTLVGTNTNSIDFSNNSVSSTNFTPLHI